MTPFKTIWANFVIVYTIDSFQDHLTYFINVYPIESFRDHTNWFLHCVPNLLNWLLTRPFDQILHSVANWLLQDHMTWFLYCLPIDSFKTFWSDFNIVYTNYSFQDHMT